MLVLESDREVDRRGVRPYAEVRGWGQASDGYNVAIPQPEGCGLQLAMELALRHAGIPAAEVDYVNAHATSTLIGDIAEARALRAVFAASGAMPANSSTKALTGHGLSLAGAMETGFCALGMAQGFTPGSAHLKTIDPECTGLNVIRETLPKAPAVTLKNSSGFGGANVSVVLKKA